MNKIERALISVSKKDEITTFARELKRFHIEILSTGGTARLLKESGIEVTEISEYIQSPELLGGRVKTLHPKIHAGILAMRDNKTHREESKQHGIKQIDLVIVNLYPFEDVIENDHVDLREAIENIDIGGPTMLRAAAKNYKYVTVVVDLEDYRTVLNELKENKGHITVETNFRLALKAFSDVARYDGAISNYLSSIDEDGERTKFPSNLTLHFEKKMGLRYGENPHQDGSFYIEKGIGEPCVSNSIQIQGKELSLNNIFDTDAAFETVKEFSETACVIVKHKNPCGVATAENPFLAFAKAKECDPESSFGGIVAFNTEVDEATASELSGMFLEVVLAPSYTEGAISTLSTKKNLRVMKTPPLNNSRKEGLDHKKVVGGLLVQDRDLSADEDFKNFKVETKRQPTDEEMQALKFAWKVCKHVKSNAIIFARDGQTIGIGAGQMSRIDSVKLASMKANITTNGSVLASDAFFPFRDGIDEAAKSGITAIVQPGGSIRDQETIAAADEHGIAMVFTGVRHFRH
ncbi:bifunctional phosphoribosylaminoimidazolecarboxamide formyltransferase/IMP cyclohydrolase [Desulfobacterota bacterium AH_259_B03_O07]|nr:bifunctional phosphoribosylaminoimidazolecarboxamide formyltransferase/IMP cyclohydrolase [Desulfobacterota bacterium AH_259_B03_O07]